MATSVMQIRIDDDLRNEAVRNGTSDMTLEEINAEIAAVRTDRRARKGAE